MDWLNFFSLFSYNLFPASVHSLSISALFYLYRSYSAMPQVGIISLTSPEDPQLLLRSGGQWQSLPVPFVGPTLTPRSVSAMLCGATSGLLGTHENLVQLTIMMWGSQESSTLPNWQLEARWDTPGI